MFEIKPNALYSLGDLEAELRAVGVTSRQFLDVVCPRKAFRDVWLGSDLLEALRAYTLAREKDRKLLRVPQRRARGGRIDPEIEQIPIPTK